IQVTAWGHALGTGLPAVDYFFADKVTVPEADRKRYAEQIVYLPSIVPFEPQWPTPEIRALPSLTKPFTFGVFNRLEKVSRQSLDLIAAVLDALPMARLL